MFPLHSILEIIKFGLNNIDTFSHDSKKIRVIDLSVANDDTLLCSFYPYATKSFDIKVEIGNIMGFFNGLFRNGGFEGISFAYYAVRACDKNGVELMYAISSKATAELIGKGNSIDWLKSTLFQENTEDYRLAQSKTIISEIENCLRELVKIKLKEEYGNNWWDKSLDNKLGKEIKNIYFQQYGIACNEGDILIQYTYTLQLKKIISTHFKLFKSYFDSLTDFDCQMDDLNRIRREEAHNRPITEKHLNELNHLHEKLLSKVLMELTTFQTGYVTTNWKLKIKKIMVERQYTPIHEGENVLNERNPQIKLHKTQQNIEHLIFYLDEMLIKLKSISTPVHKKATHWSLINVLEKYKDLQVELLQASATPDKTEIGITVTKIEEQRKKMDEFVSEFLLVEA